MTEPDARRIEDTHYAAYYARRPVTIVRGKGALLYDDRGGEYVDCTGAYGACIVGHSHPPRRKGDNGSSPETHRMPRLSLQ